MRVFPLARPHGQASPVLCVCMCVCGLAGVHGFTLNAATSSSGSLSLRHFTDELLRAKYASSPSAYGDISRVLKCWHDFCDGKRVVNTLPDGSVQEADCFLEGLPCRPFHPVNEYAWASALEMQSRAMQRELTSVLSDENKLKTGNNVWVGAFQEEGAAYGPQWKTFGLQDRGVWDISNVKLLPVTTQAVLDSGAPSCEIMFARQGPQSGIASHSDNNNFILTYHLGIDVPQPVGSSWIKVGTETRPWKNGHSLIFDTSVLHETGNESDSDRLVLLIRFWHPDVSAVERDALQLIFTCLDVADLGADALKQFEAMVLSDGYRPQQQLSKEELQKYLLELQKEKPLTKADEKRKNRGGGRGFA